MKYQVTITSIGDFVLQFLKIRDSLIIYNKNVPYHYREMVVSHTIGELKEDICVGDTLVLGDFSYKITKIGENFMKNLKENGHCTIIFNGESEVIQPGEIIVSGKDIPRIMVGDTIEFL